MASYIVLLGPPGAGKGTHAKIMSERYRLPHVSPGDLLRSQIQAETSLGKEAKAFVENGKLVPDELAIQMVEERLKEADAVEGFLLDGFPRTVEQAEALEIMLKKQNKAINMVLEFATTKDMIIRRLSGRRICEKCGENYNTRNFPPKVEGICDNCGSQIVQRKDDQPETIAERLKVYESETTPILDFYKQRGVLRPLDGDLDVEPLQAELANWMQRS